IGIDLQGILITRNRLGLIVFLGQQIAPCDESFGVARIALRDNLQDVVGVVEVLGLPESARNPEQIVRGADRTSLEVVDQLLVNGLGFIAFARIVKHSSLLVLR